MEARRLPGLRSLNNETPSASLARRAMRPGPGWLSVESRLENFALISYAFDPVRLNGLLPGRLEPFLLDCGSALISAVPFLNRDFRFLRLLPRFRANFGQTNYRVYVRDKLSGEQGIWFLGTSLGSVAYLFPRHLWGLPWHRARFTFDWTHNVYSLRIRSAWGIAMGDARGIAMGEAAVEAEDTGEPMHLLPGFTDIEQQRLILTHPVRGYYNSHSTKATGTYTIWHPPAELTIARPRRLWFRSLAESGLVTPREMNRPHSVLLQRSILYQIHLPPEKLRSG